MLTSNTALRVIEVDEMRFIGYMGLRAVQEGKSEWAYPDGFERISGPTEPTRWIDVEDISGWESFESRFDGWSHDDCVARRRKQSIALARSIKRIAKTATSRQILDECWQRCRQFDNETKQMGIELKSVLRHCRGALVLAQKGMKL